MRIKKGDKVQVLTGKDRGKRADVARALPAEGKVMVEGVHVAKRHAKPTRATMQGGVIDKFMPMSVSSVAIVCGSCGPGPDRDAHRRAGAQAARLPQVRDGPLMASTSAPRAAPPQAALRRPGAGPAPGDPGPGQHHGGAAPHQDRDQHGRRPGHPAEVADRGAMRDLEIIAGQKPVVTRARKSIAIVQTPRGAGDRRQGHAAGRPGLGVLRPPGDRGHPQDPRLPRVVAPLVRRAGQLFTFGVTGPLIFPEIDYDRIDTTRGMDITIATTARTDDEGRALLAAFGFPFRQGEPVTPWRRRL